MSRYIVGQTVYMGRGDKMRTLTVKRVIDNPMLPLYQYSFEEVNFACGEQSVRDTIEGRDLTISECTKDNYEDQVITGYNTRSNGYGQKIDATDAEFEDSSLTNLFFKPDLKFCKWLKARANGKLIIDVGCGQGHLVRMLKMVKAKAMGIEPNLDYGAYMQMRMLRGDISDSVNEILPYSIESAESLINGLGAEKCMLVFARPCHSNFVTVGLRNMPDGMEAIYITVPENLDLYNDMGEFEDIAEFVEHEGRSEDNEVVYSIIK